MLSVVGRLAHCNFVVGTLQGEDNLDCLSLGCVDPRQIGIPTDGLLNGLPADCANCASKRKALFNSNNLFAGKVEVVSTGRADQWMANPCLLRCLTHPALVPRQLLGMEMDGM